jgi:hypothetical protein
MPLCPVVLLRFWPYNGKGMSSVWVCLYNLVLSLWIGGISIFTFIITPVIFRSFGRDMAGEIVGKLFPGYFLYCLLLSFLTLALFLPNRSHIAASAQKWSLLLIIVAILINLFVSVKLHPEIRKIKQEIHSFEAESQESPQRKRFMQFHGASAVLNLLLLADGTALLVISTALRKS